MSHLEGVVEQINLRLEDINARMPAIETRMNVIETRMNVQIVLTFGVWATIVGMLLVMMFRG